jgi:hypothetical protein
MRSRTAVDTPTRLFTFDTFEEANRFTYQLLQAGHVVTSMYDPTLTGPLSDTWRERCFGGLVVEDPNVEEETWR